MTLNEGTPQSFSDNSGQTAHVKFTADKSILVYDDVAVGTGQARILDISSGSLSVGGANEINTDRIKPDIDALSTTAAILAYLDGASSDDLTLRKLSITGTTVTEQSTDVVTTSTVGNRGFRVAATTASLGLVAYTTGPGGHKLCRFTVSGDAVTAGTPQAHGTDTTGAPLGMVALDSNKVLYFYYDSSKNYKFQVIDISSGISEGTPSAIPGKTSPANSNQISNNSLAMLSSTKAVAMLADDQATDTLEVICVTTSGSSIDTIGTPVIITTSNTDYWAAIAANGSAGAVIIYRNGSDNNIVETLTVSGTTITMAGDDLTLTKTQGQNNMSVPVLADTKAVAVLQSAVDSDGYASLITGVPSGAVTTYGEFYFGAGALSQKFTLPFSGVNPKGMTLDQVLGTVVIGGKVASTDPIIYSQYPYITGTATHDGFPTGTSITVVRWI